MDIKAKIDEVVEKIKNDKDFAAEFTKDPVKAAEKVLGVDLPDDVINSAIDGIKAKLKADDVKEKLGGLGNMRGSIIAATVLTVLPEVLRSFSDYRMLVYAVVLIVMMLATNNPTLKNGLNLAWSKIAGLFRKNTEKGEQANV